MDRISWDDYFISMCFLVSQRSLDPHTKHGCVAVDKNHSILGCGYNSPPRGCDDTKVPLTRPEKYKWFVHSEANLVANAARNGIKLDGATIYITGFPCIECLRLIINTGISEIVYGPKNSVMNLDEDTAREMLKNKNINIRQHIPKFKEMLIKIE